MSVLKFIEVQELPAEKRALAVAEVMVQVDNLVRQGVIDREQSKMRTADMYFSSAFAIALEYGWPDKAVNIAAHQALIFKIRYTTEGNNPGLLLGMYAHLYKGMTVQSESKLQGQPAAVIYLRIADYHLLKGNIQRAEEHYNHALTQIGESTPEYAEYLSHYGLCQVLNGRPAEGIQNLEEAELRMDVETRLEPEHRKTVLCGICLRLAKAYRTIGDLPAAEVKLKQARILAEDLKANHDSPHRLAQVEQFEAEAAVEAKQ